MLRDTVSESGARIVQSDANAAREPELFGKRCVKTREYKLSKSAEKVIHAAALAAGYIIRKRR
jgi:hypothetical protein